MIKIATHNISEKYTKFIKLLYRNISLSFPSLTHSQTKDNILKIDFHILEGHWHYWCIKSISGSERHASFTNIAPTYFRMQVL